MLSGYQHLNLVRGQTFSQTFTGFDATGTAIDFTLYNISGVIKNRIENTGVLAQFNITTGESGAYTASIPWSGTTGFVQTRALFEFNLYDTGNNIKYRTNWGYVNIYGDLL